MTAPNRRGTRTPSSLTIRLIALLIVSLLAVQTGVFLWSVHMRSQEQLKLIASDRARLAVTVHQLLDRLPAREKKSVADRLKYRNFTLSIIPAGKTPTLAQSYSQESLLLRRILKNLFKLTYPDSSLQERIITNVEEIGDRWSVQPSLDLPESNNFIAFRGKAALPFEDNTWLLINYTAILHISDNLFGLLIGLAIQLMLQIILTVVIIRLVTRPLRQLARVAEQLPPNLPEEALDELPSSGAREVVQTSQALKAMLARIRHFVDERMRLLACLSHDLRTPIARLRLQLESEPELRRPDLVFDALGDLQNLAESAIELARSGQDREPVRRASLKALLESLVADFEEHDDPVGRECLEGADCRLRLLVERDAQCLIRPAAFRRCVENLVSNALNYGRTTAIFLEIDAKEKRAVIRIEDDGPGIPDEKLEEVFQPFCRLESTARRHGRGAGLGLSIARDIARRNGAEISLANRPEGGLTATLILPFAPDAGDCEQ